MKNEEEISVFIAGSDASELFVMSSLLSECGMKVAGTAECGNDAVSGVIKTGADVLLTEFILAGDDGLSVCRRVKEKVNPPAVIVTSPYISGFISSQISNAGPDCFLITPVNSAKLAQTISDCARYRREMFRNGSYDYEGHISDILKNIGVPVNLKGYRLIFDALLISSRQPSCLCGIMDGLYPKLASMHSSTAARVERNIRNAVEIAFDRCDPVTLEKYFGNTVSAERGKPTNGEFLSMITQKLVLDARLENEMPMGGRAVSRN